MQFALNGANAHQKMMAKDKISGDAPFNKQRIH